MPQDYNASLSVQVNIIVPIAFLLVCGFLVFLPLYVQPHEVGMGLLITGSGVPAYFLFVYWQNKPKIVRTALGEWSVYGCPFVDGMLGQCATK